jgi:hypothetical protein
MMCRCLLLLVDTLQFLWSLHNIPQRLSIELTDRGWLSRNWLVWHKTNPKPESVKTDGYKCDLSVFTKSQNYYLTLIRFEFPTRRNQTQDHQTPQSDHSLQSHQETW